MKPVSTSLLAVVIVSVLYGCGSGSSSNTGAAVANTTPNVAPPVACSAAGKTLTFDTSKTGLLYAKGDMVCFDASSTALSFNAKTLSNPIKNTVVALPFSAYTFSDGALKYEVVFNGSTLREINLSDTSGFVGQFS